MALTSTSTGTGRAYSIGPVKQQVLNIAAVSGDTSGTITATNFNQIELVEVSGGMRLTAAPTFSNAIPPVITLAFTDPSTAGWFGTITIHGK